MAKTGKLITEYMDHSMLSFVNESMENGKTKYMIEGPFIQTEIENKNKRFYKRSIIESAVKTFNEVVIAEGRAFMELDHPSTANITLKNTCGIIKKLEMDGNDAIGKSQLLPDTPNGRIAISILEGGGKLGVSSRGVGTLSGKYVNPDFKIVTVDVVANPSAPKGFVEGILESKEYIIDGDEIVEAAVMNLQKQVDKKYDSKAVLDYCLEFLYNIR